MATVTKSIGTTGRDYSTVTLWEADLDDGATYSSGDDAVGEIYADSDFDESVTFAQSGETIGLNSITLKPAAGEGHDGTPNTGVRFLMSTTRTFTIDTDEEIAVVGIEFDLNNTNSQIACERHNGTGARLRRLLMHELNTGNQSGREFIEVGYLSRAKVYNSVFYDALCTSSSTGSSVSGLYGPNHAQANAYNVTAHDVRGPGTENPDFIRCIGSHSNDLTVRSSIASDPTEGFVSTTTIQGVNHEYCVTTDGNPTTGTGHVLNQLSSDIYVSTVRGSEDLSLKAGSPAIGAGNDNGFTWDEVDIDITGATHNDPRDAGAYANVGGGSTVEPDGVSLGLAVGEPAITQQYAIQPDGVSLSMTVGSPAVTQQHTIAPGDVTLPLTVGTPSLTQVHIIAPSDVLLALGVDSPSITQAGSVAPDDVDLGLTVDSPTIVQAHNVAPDDVSLPLSIDEAVVQVAGSVSPDDVSLALLLDTLTIIQRHAIAPDDVDISLLVDSTTVTTSGITIAPVDVALALSVDATAITQYHVITPDDITLQLLVDVVSLGGLVIGELEGTIYVYAALDGSVEAFPALSGTVH